MKDSVDLREWYITYKEFNDWIIGSDADVYSLAFHNMSSGTHYEFENTEDFVAFKLKFKKR